MVGRPRVSLFFALVALVVGQLFVMGAGPAAAGAPDVRNVSTGAQYQTALGGACAGPVVIEILANITLTAEPLFPSDCDLTINGNGHTLNGNDNSRSVVGYTGGGTLSVNDVVAINGDTPDDGGSFTMRGGAIAVGSGSTALVVTNSEFRQNDATDWGGAIFSDAVASVNGSELVQNTADDGAAITSGPEVLNVIGSSFRGNEATNDGGAVLAQGGDALIANSTFFDNEANRAGAIYANFDLDLIYSTLASNSSPDGASLKDSGAGQVELFGVTLSDAQGGDGHCDDTSLVDAASYSRATDASCDLEGAGATNVDDASSPQLGAITNGWWGPPQAMVPVAGSPLVNAIPPGSCNPTYTTDQRGVVRPSGSGCDIGAVERDVVAPMVAVAGVSDGAVYNSGNVPGAFCTQTDPGGSGIATPATLELSGPASGVGGFTATCSGATDKEGNIAAPVSVMYTVVFNAADAWYGMVETDGTVYTFPSTRHQGNAALAAQLGETAVDFVINNDGTGYYVLTSFGRVLPFGAGSANQGDLNLGILLPGESVEAMALTESGDGYWIFTSRGRASTFGDAPDIGDVSSLNLNAPVVDAAPYPPGFYMAAGDGGVFTPPEFIGSQQVPFYGSMGATPLNEPVVTIYVDASDDDGYTLAAADGGMFNFRSKFCNSVPGILAPGTSLNQPVVNAVPWGTCYLVFAADGGAFNFSVGELPFLGSLGDNPPDTPITSGDAYFE